MNIKLTGMKDDVRAEISNAEVLLIGYMISMETISRHINILG